VIAEYEWTDGVEVMSVVRLKPRVRRGGVYVGGERRRAEHCEDDSQSGDKPQKLLRFERAAAKCCDQTEGVAHPRRRQQDSEDTCECRRAHLRQNRKVQVLLELLDGQVIELTPTGRELRRRHVLDGRETQESRDGYRRARRGPPAQSATFHIPIARLLLTSRRPLLSHAALPELVRSLTSVPQSQYHITSVRVSWRLLVFRNKRVEASITRVLRPRLSDCLVVWLLAGLCFGVPLLDRLSDPDLGWHLQTGKMIVEGRFIPSTDPFSYTMAGKPWLLHEWLSEVAFWLVYSRFGFPGLSVLRSLLILATFTMVYSTALRRTDKQYAAVIATVFAALVGKAFWSERPQLFGYLLLAVLVWLIHRHRRGGALWPAAPLLALWVNLHGSWLAGLVVFMAYGLETGWEALRGRDSGRFRSFTRVAPFAVLALFVNPRPFTYAAYPFQYIGHTHHTEYITEWHSPNFHESVFACFALTLTLLPALLRASRTKTHPVEFALVMSLLGASLYSMRHLPVLGIVAAPFIAEHLASIDWRRGRPPRPVKETPEPVPLNWLMILVLPLLIFIRLPDGGPTPYVDFSKYPKRSFDYLEADREGERLLTHYNWGGYAIFRLWPDYRVFIDGRADVYGRAVIDRVDVLDDLKPGWRRELAHGGPDAIVWPSDKPLSQALELVPGWRRVHLQPDDKVAALFVRVNSSER